MSARRDETRVCGTRDSIKRQAHIQHFCTAVSANFRSFLHAKLAQLSVHQTVTREIRACNDKAQHCGREREP